MVQLFKKKIKKYFLIWLHNPVTNQSLCIKRKISKARVRKRVDVAPFPPARFKIYQNIAGYLLNKIVTIKGQ